MNRRMSHGQAIRSTLAFSLVTHFTAAVLSSGTGGASRRAAGPPGMTLV
jgi:hypothetical protein